MSIHTTIHARRTVRKFQQTPLSAQQLKTYINAARVAPSASNLQPLRYIAVQSHEMTEKMFPLVKWAGYLAPHYNPKPEERPTAYVVVCADTRIRKAGYDMDVGAAVENLMLTAWEDGVGACWIGSVERSAVRQLLHIPEYLVVSCVVALGYRGESPKEVAVAEGIAYYLDEIGTLCVPKQNLDTVLLDIF